MSSLASNAILAYETALARVILATVVEATPALGRPPSRGFVAAVLAGSLRADLIAADGHRLTTFGLLARQGLDSIHAWIDALMRARLIELVRGRRALICTAQGRAVGCQPASGQSAP